MIPQLKPGTGPRVGAVTSVTLAESSCMVLVSEGEVPAYLTDQTIDRVDVGTIVTLLPVGDTYQVVATRGGAGSGGIGASYGPELLANPGFEYGDTTPNGWSWWPWVGGDYAATRDTTPAEMVSGSARMLVTLRGGVDGPDVNVWPSQAVRVDPGASYQFSVWVKASAIVASLTTEIYLMTAPTADGATFFGAGSVGSTAATVTSPGAAYQLLTGNATIPTGHGYARAFLHATASAAIAAPVSVSWDEASLRQRITS